MESSERPARPARAVSPDRVGEDGLPLGERPENPTWSARRAYAACEGITEGVLYFMVVFNPWAFGTTQVWSTWVMNGAGYLLGLLLALKGCVRRWSGFQPDRWVSPAGAEPGEAAVRSPRWRSPTVWLAVLTMLVLAQCLISALNPRGTYSQAQGSYRYFENWIPWLPHSYDRASTWFVFWEYLGLALTFWAARDWLLGKTRREAQASAEAPLDVSAAPLPPVSLPLPPRFLPDRLRRFLWVLCLNGAVLAVECLIQRQDQSNKLLWLLETRRRIPAQNLYGPYPYQGNAAQYFNLLWPVGLGFWWILRLEARRALRFGARVGGSAHVVLLPCLVLMAASPVLSTSRGGSIIALGSLVAALLVLVSANRQGHWLARLGLLGAVLALVALGVFLRGVPLAERFQDLFPDGLPERAEVHQNARQMARDFPVFGAGPGTFCTLYYWYRQGPKQIWAAQAHDDWLETRITFGWVGLVLLLSSLGLVLAHWRAGQGIQGSWILGVMLWLALAACLIHATFDFPLQIHSVLSLFLFHCSILFCLVRKPPALYPSP